MWILTTSLLTWLGLVHVRVRYALERGTLKTPDDHSTYTWTGAWVPFFIATGMTILWLLAKIIEAARNSGRESSEENTHAMFNTFVAFIVLGPMFVGLCSVPSYLDGYEGSSFGWIITPMYISASLCWLLVTVGVARQCMPMCRESHRRWKIRRAGTNFYAHTADTEDALAPF